MSPNRRPAKLVFTLAVCLLCACQGAATKSTSEPVRLQTHDSSAGMTRQQLDSELRRFAQRYVSKLTQFFEEERAGELTPKQRREAVLSELRVTNAAIAIAIGDNSVTNLLDMLVLTTLMRMVAEREAAALYSDDRAAELVNITRKLETDAWKLSADVLTTSQQAELKDMIKAWREDNPSQIYVTRVRFSSFSGDGADDLAEVQRTGGLLSQFARAADEVEELRLFGERLLFYMDFAPYLYALHAESTVYDILMQSEIQDTLGSINGMAGTIERLPDSRLEFIDQLLEGISVEREALLTGIVDEQAGISQLLSDLRPVLESAAVLAANLNQTMQAVERTADAVNLDMGGEGADIGSYQLLAIESATTVVELRQLVESLETLSRSQLINEQVPPAFETLRQEFRGAFNRFFTLAAFTIILFFVALYLYRRASYKYRSPRA
jgi:hypothetical protein